MAPSHQLPGHRAVVFPWLAQDSVARRDHGTREDTERRPSECPQDRVDVTVNIHETQKGGTLTWCGFSRVSLGGHCGTQVKGLLLLQWAFSSLKRRRQRAAALLPTNPVHCPAEGFQVRPGSAAVTEEPGSSSPRPLARAANPPLQPHAPKPLHPLTAALGCPQAEGDDVDEST